MPGWLGTDVQGEVLQHILDVKPDRILLITDETVDSLHGKYFAPLLRGGDSDQEEDGETGACPKDSPKVDKFVLP